MDGSGRRLGANATADRSREWLSEALFHLMREKPYGDITVTDIAERAQLSRRTYYRNVQSKEELVALRCRRLVDDYVTRLRDADLAQTRDVALVFFTFWTDHADFLRTLVTCGMSGLILQKFNEHIAEVFHRSASPKYAHVPHIEYALAFNAGGYFNVLFEWLRRGARETPSEMADAVASIGTV
ncbi:AcrR family transcriptional regulator [Gordonia spumicola]|uniref:AcrR family transcriptional regulator n=1 Tax=Gordonia spumicola TaxID=589161 RepID=A0A7I9V595_9ACTN|nr:TetR/AcrR family transcriptional regulator [Gordonia spumicola]GEE00588.1 AcrR family transcriptional regulator [Gordonia spumicola]